MVIGVIDYGAGNIRSVCNALERLERRFSLCSKPEDLSQVDVCVLPGVGQFASAIRHMKTSGMVEALRDWGQDGRPIVGICLGLQLLFASSDEAPDAAGLALISGRVVKLKTSKSPHMGWNKLSVCRRMNWLEDSDAAYFYFAHGFYVQPDTSSAVVASVTIDDLDVPAVIETGAIRATQFHPEKSGSQGDRLLKRMLEC